MANNGGVSKWYFLPWVSCGEVIPWAKLRALEELKIGDHPNCLNRIRHPHAMARAPTGGCYDHGKPFSKPKKCSSGGVSVITAVQYIIGGDVQQTVAYLTEAFAVSDTVAWHSSYPWTVLGLPPVWYKSAPYRSRAVRDPRGVLDEFGVMLPDDTEVRVWDSTAEIRYLVIPKRPAGTDGWSEERLADLVTRNSMIGTGLALDPSELENAA